MSVTSLAVGKLEDVIPEFQTNVDGSRNSDVYSLPARSTIIAWQVKYSGILRATSSFLFGYDTYPDTPEAIAAGEVLDSTSVTAGATRTAQIRVGTKFVLISLNYDINFGSMTASASLVAKAGVP